MLRLCIARYASKKFRHAPQQPTIRRTTSPPAGGASIQFPSTTVPEGGPSSSNEQISRDTNKIANQQYDALLRKILPLQRDNLEGFLEALKEERGKLEAVCDEFDEKLKQMESIREEIRLLVRDADRKSIERRNEIVASLRE